MFTPAEAGASSTGTNANEPHYALEPAALPQNRLMIYFNASLSHPAMQIADADRNFYNAAARSGLHVLAISYESAQVLGLSCSSHACYEAARKTVILGQAQPNAPTGLMNIRPDEGAVQRIIAALQYLAVRRPGQGWDQFLTSSQIVWNKIVAAGHSQGGGHAAMLGKLYTIHSVIQLSSTCDRVGTTPAAWTSDNLWATPPATSFWGFGTAGDTICAGHVDIWNAMGLSMTRQLDNAATCAGGGGSHGGSVGCASNYPTWLTFF